MHPVQETSLLIPAAKPEWWLPKQVNELVRELKREGAITADEVPGRRFGAAANPVLRLAKQQK